MGLGTRHACIPGVLRRSVSKTDTDVGNGEKGAYKAGISIPASFTNFLLTSIASHYSPFTGWAAHEQAYGREKGKTRTHTAYVRLGTVFFLLFVGGYNTLTSTVRLRIELNR